MEVLGSPGKSRRNTLASIAVFSVLALKGPAAAGERPVVRFAQFNCSLNRNAAGQLLADLSTPGNAQAKAVAEIIQRVNPDVLLLNEFDFEPDLAAATLFQDNYLAVSQNGAPPVEFPHVFVAPSNTGLPTGFDLNNNGRLGEADDALGFGFYPGQFGMAVFSKYPIHQAAARTFQKFLWKDMPGALLPDDPVTAQPADWYSAEELAVFRLSSKSHWDIPVEVNGELVHVLVSHPTPPVFDGPEDRNGTRNHDEIRLWADYVTPGRADYLYDDAGVTGGLAPGSRFVIMGDQNADPQDGDSVEEAILQLLDSPLINTTVTPASEGGPEQSALQGRANDSHEGDPAFDTADFADSAPGNLRADYVLPSVDLRIADAAVFWPRSDDPLFRLVGVFPFPTSDHRLVWVDVDVLPQVLPVVETRRVLDADDLPAGERFGDADDPAVWVHPVDPALSVFAGALKDGGLDVYDLSGQLIQEIAPDDVRYNNIDVQYGFPLAGRRADIFAATDRRNDRLIVFRIDPETRLLEDVTDPENPLVFTPAGEESDQTTTAYGVALYRSPVTEKFYAFVSRRTTGRVAQLELFDNGSGLVSTREVRCFTVPDPEDAEPQVEGMVADHQTGVLYVGQEQAGIWRYSAEPDGGEVGTLIDAVHPGGTNLKADAEGLTIYYAAEGKGYLLASSQGDSTFAVYTREGANSILGSFRIARSGDIDSVEECDGAQVVNVPLGPGFPRGLLAVHDGGNDPPFLVEDDGEIENASTNFKLVPWERVAGAFDPHPLVIDTESFDPRQPPPGSLPGGVAAGDVTQISAVLWARTTAPGKLLFEVSTTPDFRQVVRSARVTPRDPLEPVKVHLLGLHPRTRYHYRATDAAGEVARGVFRTSGFPFQGSGLCFGVTGDWRGELAPYPAIANVPERDLEFLVELGDTVYADVPSPAVPAAQARTLEEYRRKHAEVYGRRYGLNSWAELRASTAILAAIDDHEVINDFAGGAPPSSDPRFLPSSAGFINDTDLYETGLRAFQDYNPVRNDFYGPTGDPRTSNERKLFRFSTYGNAAAVFLLDARSFRDRELPPVANPFDPAQVAAFIARSFDPSRTMLGRKQVDDLKAGLLLAQAAGMTWKFILVPEPIQNLGVVAASDRFEGYAAERTELLSFIRQRGITDVVFVAADIHGTLVNNLTYQEGPGMPQLKTGAFEVTTGPVAYDAPFGPTVIELAAALGLLTPGQRAFYDSLPAPGKDLFLENLVNAQLASLGYDPLGLAGSGIDATLVRGGYTAVHVYGWTEFSIDAETHELRVITYGIDPYSEQELRADPFAVIGRTPRVVSEFKVKPRGKPRHLPFDKPSDK